MAKSWKKIAARRVLMVGILFLGGIAATMSPASDRVRTQQWINISVAEFNRGEDPDFARGMRLISKSVTPSQCQAINELWNNLTERWNTVEEERATRREVGGIGLPLPINFGLNLARHEGQYLPYGAQAFRSTLVISCPDSMRW